MSIYGELTSGRDYALAVIVSTVLRKKPRPQCRQIPLKTILDDSNSTSCWLCHKSVRMMFERMIFQCNVGSRTVGCCEHIAAVLWYPSYQRNQAGDVLSETNFCGTVNVLEVVDTNLESK